MLFSLKLCPVKCTMFKVVYTLIFLSSAVASEMLKGDSNWGTIKKKQLPLNYL